LSRARRKSADAIYGIEKDLDRELQDLVALWKHRSCDCNTVRVLLWIERQIGAP
jgi:hypothetical protein